MTLNLKDFLQGKKTVVEVLAKRPVGRPRKRPDGIEGAIKEELPDMEQEIQSFAKPVKGETCEISSDSSDVEDCPLDLIESEDEETKRSRQIQALRESQLTVIQIRGRLLTRQIPTRLRIRFLKQWILAIQITTKTLRL